MEIFQANFDPKIQQNPSIKYNCLPILAGYNGKTVHSGLLRRTHETDFAFDGFDGTIDLPTTEWRPATSSALFAAACAARSGTGPNASTEPGAQP